LETWEYMAEFIGANTDKQGVQEYLQQTFPGWEPPQFAPQAMIPRLNDWGKEGWELIHMEPIQGVGDKGNVIFDPQLCIYSNAYFCVFKRRKSA
jgi:hypothetical protein